MEDGKSTGTPAPDLTTPKRRQAGEPKRTAAKARAKEDVNGLRLQALTALTTLGENDRFILVIEKQGGATSTVSCWT